jgi:hypothetical protein
MKRTIRVKVGEIVVEGLAARESAAFRRALEREIRRQVQGDPAGVHAPASKKADSLAREAAGKLVVRLPREARRT